jgi:hypothetical protein
MLRPWLALLVPALVAGCAEKADDPIGTRSIMALGLDEEAPRVTAYVPMRDRAVAAAEVVPELKTRPAPRAPRAVVTEGYPAPEPPAERVELEHAPSALEIDRPPRRAYRAVAPIPSPAEERRASPPPPEEGISLAALGVGGIGAGVAAMSTLFLADEPSSTETTAVFGTMLGLGVAAMAVGGVIAIVDAEDQAEIAITIAPAAISIGGSF